MKLSGSNFRFRFRAKMNDPRTSGQTYGSVYTERLPKKKRLVSMIRNPRYPAGRA